MISDISARKAKRLDATTMVTYSHANTPLGQSKGEYYQLFYKRLMVVRPGYNTPGRNTPGCKTPSRKNPGYNTLGRQTPG